VSFPEQLDPRTQEILDRYRFDAAQFGRLQEAVAAGRLAPETNVVEGTVEPPAEEDLVRLSDEARAAGVEAVRRGEVAVAVLNGGMATRFGGLVKGVVEAVDGRSFLEWKMLETDRVARGAGGELPFAVMNSFATDEPTRRFVAEQGLPEPLFFSQSVLLRLERDGSLFRLADGSASPYSPGHGDFVDAIRDSGVLEQLRARGVRLLLLSNVDNLGARPDPAVIGMHLVAGNAVTAEVATKEPGDAGGAPARVDGRPVLVEGFRFPRDFDQATIGVFATNSFVFDLDVLAERHELTWLYVEKEVEGRPAVQLERLVNELCSLLPTTYLEVPRSGPRGRFFPIKTPADLETSRASLREMLAAAVV
jgi:UTP--glucose-1-phosphate uridylyltransferase